MLCQKRIELKLNTDLDTATYCMLEINHEGDCKPAQHIIELAMRLALDKTNLKKAKAKAEIKGCEFHCKTCHKQCGAPFDHLYGHSFGVGHTCVVEG